MTFKIKHFVFFTSTSLVLVSVSIILAIQYFSTQQLALNTIKTSIKHISKKTESKLVENDRIVDDFLSIAEIVKHLNENQMLMYFTTIMKVKPLVYSAYIGYENRDFYEVISLNSSKKVKSIFKAKKDEVWLVKKITTKSNKRVLENIYLAKDLHVKRAETLITNYDPTTRVWYKNALKSDTSIKTDPYVFAHIPSSGFSYSKKIKGSRDVMGVDITLNNLSHFLESEDIHKGSQLYLQGHDEIMISSNIEKSKQPKDIKNILKSVTINDTININGVEYLASHQVIKSKYDFQTTLYSFVPKDSVLEQFNEKIGESILASFLLIFLATPLILRMTSFMIKPIHALEIENEKIKNRKFSEVRNIKTRTKEFKELSESLVSMSKSMREHDDEQIKLMDSFIKLIAGAIDAKSQYTGGHCSKVPVIALMLAKAASKSQESIFKEFTLSSDDELRELSIAAWLHDCGKVTTPEYVIDKATKLETIYNRIHEVRARFEVIYRDLRIEYFEKLQKGEDEKSAKIWLESEQKKLKDDFEFIAKTNIGGEFLSEDDKNRVKQIAKKEWIKEFDDSLGLSQDEKRRYIKSDTKVETLLTDKKSHIIERTETFEQRYKGLNFKIDVPKNLYNLGEIYNLTIEKGTLTKEERFKVQEHVMMSIKMLEQLPFPKQLQRVPEYAGSHHETLIGTGYPRGLSEDEMPLPAKIMAIADVFEALTASDRPYKEGKTLSDSIKILSFMVKDKHLDADLFRLLLTSGIYKEFADEHLKDEQIDEVDIQQYIDS